MTTSGQRIFISDLPEAANDKEITSLFNKYGKVTSIEIKTRKELTTKNKSYFFAYVNLDTDHYNLNQCFRDFQEEPWHGDYVKLQIAKESFLDRLKREREETQRKQQGQEGVETAQLPDFNPVVNIPPPKISKYQTETEKPQEKPSKKNRAIETQEDATNFDQIDSFEEPMPKIRKTTPQNQIVQKIPSFGNEPIVVFNTKKDKSKNMSEANLKRLESLKNLKKGYQTEKDLIKNALKNIDSQPKNNKIVFDDDNDASMSNHKKTKVNGFHNNKNLLFHHEDSDVDDFEGNFEIQEHLEGEKGKKLLELQSKFQNDKRFTLDKRFLDKDQPTDAAEYAEESLETEKRKELDILEQVLGKKLSKANSKKAEKKTPQKSMLRFDPTQNNSNFELEKVTEEPKKKKSRKELKQEAEKEQNNEKPEVSKEVFYKVADNLKETFEETQSFSLLSTFKRTDDDQISNEQDNETGVPNLSSAKNPFKYDSSDEEDEIADIPHTNDASKTSNQLQTPATMSSRSVFWTESFFFKPDDHRLQDGFNFVEKLKVSDDKEFSKVRQDLKSVVRTKMRNSERKNRMFKRKLGGSKSSKRKHIRIKKALKR